MNYKNGFEEGKKIFYYPNGSLKQEGNYKKDKADGYLIDYFQNGQVSNEGWYKEGQSQGTHITYNLLGNTLRRNYYLNDEVHGVNEYYKPSGKLDNKQYYKWGWFYKIEQFDSTGKLLSTSTLDKGEGKVKFVYPNGKLNFESNYKNYKLNGAYTVMNGDGSKRSLNFYKNGEQDSIYTTWFPNGKTETTGMFKTGKRAGTWKYYNYEGALVETEPFNDEGELHGKNILYNDDGTIRAEYIYNEGTLEQINHIGDNNQLMASIYFKNGVPTGYTYEDKTGAKLPVIPITNGSGEVTGYYKNGQKSIEFNYKEDVIDGPFALYYSNGKPKLTLNYLNGLFHGKYNSFYMNGKPQQVNEYYYGTNHGKFISYKEDGSLRAETNFYLDSQHGENRYYTNGKLSATYIYDYGDVLLKK